MSVNTQAQVYAVYVKTANAEGFFDRTSKSLAIKGTGAIRPPIRQSLSMPWAGILRSTRTAKKRDVYPLNLTMNVSSAKFWRNEEVAQGVADALKQLTDHHVQTSFVVPISISCDPTIINGGLAFGRVQY